MSGRDRSVEWRVGIEDGNSGVGLLSEECLGGGVDLAVTIWTS